MKWRVRRAAGLGRGPPLRSHGASPILAESNGGRSVEVDMEQFPETLKELRESRGLTQARLAELIEASPRVYSRWETGAAVPRLDTLVRRRSAGPRSSLDAITSRQHASSTKKLESLFPAQLLFVSLPPNRSLPSAQNLR